MGRKVRLLSINIHEEQPAYLVSCLVLVTRAKFSGAFRVDLGWLTALLLLLASVQAALLGHVWFVTLKRLDTKHLHYIHSPHQGLSHTLLQSPTTYIGFICYITISECATQVLINCLCVAYM